MRAVRACVVGNTWASLPKKLCLESWIFSLVAGYSSKLPPLRQSGWLATDVMVKLKLSVAWPTEAWTLFVLYRSRGGGFLPEVRVGFIFVLNAFWLVLCWWLTATKQRTNSPSETGVSLSILRFALSHCVAAVQQQSRLFLGTCFLPPLPAPGQDVLSRAAAFPVFPSV